MKRPREFEYDEVCHKKYRSYDEVTFEKIHVFDTLRSQHRTNLTNVCRSIYDYQSILNLSQKTMIGLILEKYFETGRPMAILDAGCGKGIALDQLLSRVVLKNVLKLAIGISKDYFSPIKSVMVAHQQRFEFYRGTAQDVLKNEIIQVNFLFDVWGAYAYSEDKLELLGLYYGALKPGGKAYIHTPRQAWVGDTDLYDYLSKEFPNYFTCVKESDVLVMSKITERFPVPKYNVAFFNIDPTFKTKKHHTREILENGNALAANDICFTLCEKQPMTLRLKPYT